MVNPESKGKREVPPGLQLKMLNADQVRRIDALLASLGDYGEIRLIVQHGELRYINKVESYRAWRDDDKQPNDD